AEGSARELGALLGSLAAAARDEAAMRRRLEATRARARATVQIVTGLTAAMVTGLLLFDRDYLSPYDDPLGQTVLALVASFFGLGLWWLARMGRIPAPERFLAAAPKGGTQ
ncbi:MAG: type II secretion system F family protein, partial [Acidimicrobiia bacterium]